MKSGQHRLLLLIFLLCFAEFLQNGMFAFAAAPIRGEIGVSPEEYSLVTALHAWIAILGIAIHRWLLERSGWRWYVLATIALHALGCLICAQSHDLASFSLGRALMALGSAAFMISARMLVTLIPAGPGRFTGITVFCCALAAGTACAPVASSLAVSLDHWHLMFWALICCTTVAAFLAAGVLPSTVEPRERHNQASLLDLGLLAMGSFSLLYIIQRLCYDFYDHSPMLVLWLLVAVSLFGYFFHLQHRQAPLLELRQLLTPRYLLGLSLFSLSYVVMNANNYVLPTLLQTGLGMTWESIARLQSCGLAGELVTWLIMARILLRAPSPRKFYLAGFACLGGFGWLLSNLSPAVDPLQYVLPALVLNGCFVMLVLGTAATQTFREASRDDKLLSHAQQIKSIFGQLAMASGTTIATVFSQWRTTEQYAALNANLMPGRPGYEQSSQVMGSHFSHFAEAGTAARMAFAEQARELSSQATLLASINHFQILVALACACAVLIGWQRIHR
ncbi:MFS transporter [Pseudomonas piscis]|uniref:MFS transporter n=1 Tax=Pseudomonas piscis TaxID=2614538 RepID=UPI0039A6EB43